MLQWVQRLWLAVLRVEVLSLSTRRPGDSPLWRRLWPLALACLYLLTILHAEAAGTRRSPSRDFSGPRLKSSAWLSFLESGRRDVFANRDVIVAVLGLRPGMHVADVGAGSGAFMSRLVDRIGPSGHYYAIDIVPHFIRHIRDRAQILGYQNVTPVLGATTTATLPEASIDFAFICDTYVHMNAPDRMLASLYKAVKPGGEIILIDFDRQKAADVAWIRRNIRASKETYRHEFELAGFRFVREEAITSLKRNFVYRFSRP